MVPSRREAEPLGVDERRGGRRLGLEQRDVRQPGHPRVEPVDDVEVTPAECGGHVGTDADRDPHRGAGRDRYRARQGDDVLERALLERATPRDEVGRA